MRSYPFVAVLFWGLLAPLFAQSPIEQYDAEISLLLKSGQGDRAIDLMNKKADLAKKADELAVWGQTQIDIHEVFEDDYKRALAHLDSMWARRWREPKDAREWRPFLLLYANKGWFLSRLGQYWQANQAYEAAAGLFERHRYPDFDVVYTVYKPLGANYTRLGDNDKAIAVFQKALAIGGDNENLSGLYANVGIAYWNKGAYAEAEENYRKGLALSEVSATKRGLLLGRLAETMLDLERTTEAAQTAKEAIQLLHSRQPGALAYRARAHRVAGRSSTKLGRYAEAERLLSAALADDVAIANGLSREVGKDHIALAQLYLRLGRYHQALRSADLALAAVIPPIEPIEPLKPLKPTPLPSQFYEENTIFEALAVKAEAAQVLYEKAGGLHWLELALECHDLAWQAEMLLRRVYQYSSSKLLLQKDARRREEAAMNVARWLYEQTGQQQWLEKAFAIAERSKAALLLESLQDNLVRLRLSGTDPRMEELAALRRNLSFLDRNLLLEPDSEHVPQWRIEADGIRAQIATIEQAMRKDYPGLSGFQQKTANWLPVSSDFTPGEMLLEYFVSEHWVEVFVFRPNAPPIWRRLAQATGLQTLIQQYLRFFENDYAILNDPNGYLKTAYSLWQQLLPPETASATLLTVLPDGILNFVPFEALVTADAPNTNLRNAPYLLRRQTLRYAWSLAVLRQQKDFKSHAPKYLLSVAPGFPRRERGLAPLATPDFDWRGITGLDIKRLHGQDAGAQHFLSIAGNYRVLHFSTHAFADANPRIEFFDQPVLLPELYALPLQADLVMLSACQTGLGKEAKGEGVMSLARAFAQAGAASIVSSLWSVNDQSTSKLLRVFYAKIAEGSSSGAALREAKLAYLSDPGVGSAAQSPYFWAGLAAIGDDRSIAQPTNGWLWGLALLGLGLFVWVLSTRLNNHFRVKRRAA